MSWSHDPRSASISFVPPVRSGRVAACEEDGKEHSESGIMPIFRVNTNVAKSNVPAAFLSEATEELAKALGKPAKYFAVQVNADQTMTFGGKGDPCACCSLESIGQISAAQNKQYTQLLCGLLKKHLGISPDRIYIVFADVDPPSVGWNNTTFEGIDLSTLK